MKKIRHLFKRRRISGRRWAPFASAAVCLALLAGCGYLLYTYVPKWAASVRTIAPDLSCIGYTAPTPLPPKPTPVPTPSPEPWSDEPLYGVDLKSVQHEILVPEYQYVSDLWYSGGKLYFAAGDFSARTSLAKLEAVCCADFAAGTRTYYRPSVLNRTIRFPRMNDTWLVFMDAFDGGGGNIRRMELSTGQELTIKTVPMGVPIPQLYEDSAYWLERTGSTRYKLYGCDLISGECVTLDVFDGAGGQSDPFIYGHTLYYVGAEQKLFALDVRTGEKAEAAPGERVHDPQYNGQVLAYLTGNHGYSGELRYMDDTGSVHTAANGVTDFALGDGFIAYEDLQGCYVYLIEDGFTFCVTRGEETNLLQTAGGDCLFWLDTTWRDKDILEYMHVSDFSGEG